MLQGSGPEYGQIPSPFRHYSTDGSDMSSPHPHEEFGPFQQGLFQAPALIDRRESEETEADGADFGAENYNRRARSSGGSGGAGSDSRSGTSASLSNADLARYEHYTSQRLGSLPHTPLSPQDTYVEATPTKKKKSRKSGRHSTSTASQSTGPVSPPPQVQSFAPQPMIATPDNGYEGQQQTVIPEAAVNSVEQSKTTGFPSTGLRGGMSRKNSEAGVFLARRGDN